MAKANKLIFEILEAEKEKLFQYASYRLRDINDVEDVLQNLYLKILDNPERFNSIENKRAYLYRIVSNECTSLLRDNVITDSLNSESLAIIDIEALQPENFEEEFNMINQLLGLLPFEQSEVIRLRHHSDLSFQEIADIMEVPLPTAKARYRYGIEKIRKSLKTINLL